jgi:hypothetical protein
MEGMTDAVNVIAFIRIKLLFGSCLFFVQCR